MINFTGMHIVVTGANGALGQAVIDQALKLGAEIHALDIIFDPSLEKLANESNSPLQLYQVDLTESSAVSDTINRIEKIDAVFNLVGGFSMGEDVFDTTKNNWHELLKLNVTTVQNVLDAVVPKLKTQQSGKVVNVGAIGAIKGQAKMSSYCATKSIVMRLTESLSEEVKLNGINVNAVLPSCIDTPSNRANMPDADFTTWVDPASLASTICFLGSDAARSIHGALVPVAGLC